MQGRTYITLTTLWGSNNKVDDQSAGISTEEAYTTGTRYEM